MTNVCAIPLKTYRYDSSCIPPCNRRHNYIPYESCSKYGDKSTISERMTLREYEIHDRCDENKGCDFPCYCSDETKLCAKVRLQQAHDRTIHESEQSKKSSNCHTNECKRTIISWKEKRYRSGKKNNHDSHKRTETQYIRCYFFNPFSIIDVLRDFSHSDRIETEISDDSKEREIVIDFTIEPISRHIEIARENLDHEDRDKCCHDFRRDLSERIREYFS